MSTKRIEQLIEEIFEFVESCKASAFSGSKVIVPKEELYDLLDELRLKVPEEIKRCQKMIANRDAIIADAEHKAVAIEQSARQQAQILINENEITQGAYYQANEMMRQATEQRDAMLSQATQDAMQITQGALSYANDMLSNVEQVLSSSYEITKNRSDAMLEALRQNLAIVTENRKELLGGMEPQGAKQVSQPGEPQAEDFEFDEDIFLNQVDDDEE